MSKEETVEPSPHHPNPERWWTNRRKLAFNSFYWLIAQTVLFSVIAVSSPSAMESLGAVVAWSYGSTMVPIIGYFGNTVVEEWMKKR